MGEVNAEEKERIPASPFHKTHLWECATCAATGVAMGQERDEDTTLGPLSLEEKPDLGNALPELSSCTNCCSDVPTISSPAVRIASGRDCNANECLCHGKPVGEQVCVQSSCLLPTIAPLAIVAKEKAKVFLRSQTSFSLPTSPQVFRRPLRTLSVDWEKNLPRTTLPVFCPTSTMTQDVYQRQPLLPGKGKAQWDIPDTLINPLEGNVVFYGSQHLNGNPSGIVGNGGCSTNNDSGIVRIEVPAPLREEPKFPREKLKTLVAFFFVVINSFFSTLSLAMVHEKVPDRDKYDPLPDVFLDHVSPADWGLDVSESLIIVSSASCIVLLFFHKHRLIILRRLFLILGLLYLMRAITMYITVLPMASRTYYCSPKLNNTNVGVVTLRAVKMLLGMGLTINGQHVFCGDYIFSGHTAILVMAYLIIQEYTPRSCLILHWCACLANIIGVVFLMMAHAHYTVDVVIAYFVTTRLFWVYHTLANNATLKQRGPSNYLSRVWWYPIFMYFERNVGGPVPRKYEWPLPWPRQFLSKYPERDS